MILVGNPLLNQEQMSHRMFPLRMFPDAFQQEI